MLPFERCTVRRTALNSAILRRVWRALRKRSWFWSYISAYPGFPLFLLGFLDHDLLAGIAHALALVRLRAAIGAHFGRHLADHLPVHALDHDLGLRRRLHLDALRHRVGHRVRESEREVQFVALRLRAVTHAHQGQALLEALGDA